jgi:molybdopterin-containing oxidoreductase family iron-sulfur binding subunit
MVIDLTRCIGCQACMVACKVEHVIPPGIFWGRVLMKEYGKYPTARKQIVPVLCNHCKEAPCVEVCPTGATNKREDGLVTVDYDQCVGCRYCMMACPYGARYYYADEDRYFPNQSLTPLEEQGYGQYQAGTVVKCTFCAERIDRGKEEGLEVGKDRQATPMCVVACPASARHFGDLDDPSSDVSRLIKEKGGQPLQPEKETEPSVYYIRY